MVHHKDLMTDLPRVLTMQLGTRWALQVCVVQLVLCTIGVCGTIRNIVFMLTDDGGFEMSPYGNNITNTTNLQWLADHGVTFDNAQTAVSSCSPSRSAILSGLPTHQNGMYGLHQYPGNFQSNNDITSLPVLLSAAGFKTGVIGKYHVGPNPNYQFDYGMDTTNCWTGAIVPPCSTANYNQQARNLTNIKQNIATFLDSERDKPFFLYIGWGDCHRCAFKGAQGSFCELYGSGKGDEGIIPDWTPQWFSPEQVTVPPFLPDNTSVREDIAAQYTAVNRMDQGVGIVLDQLKRAGHLDDTLIVYFSDNGIPFPSAKTNLYEQGMGEPLIMAVPGQQDQYLHGVRSSAVVSSLDLMPTFLQIANTTYPSNATAGKHPATLTGTSLLPLIQKVTVQTASNAQSSSSTSNVDATVQRSSYTQARHANAASGFSVDRAWNGSTPAFASHNFHSLYAYYPMRAVRTEQYRLIHNLLYHASYAILEDVYTTDTWRELQSRGEQGKPTGWIYDYHTYMFRPEFQLFDVAKDPLCLNNLADEPAYAQTLSDMQEQLLQWRNATHDPWLPCSVNSTANECSY
eukprot:m.303684 g.303684  ORF g.303684 m.303684 type:complete len:572 (-) comp15894_c0_seq5:119-1834(-)